MNSIGAHTYVRTLGTVNTIHAKSTHQRHSDCADQIHKIVGRLMYMKGE